MFANQTGYIDFRTLGELPVVDLRQKQQGSVEPYDAAQRPLHLEQLAHLLFRELGPVQQPFEPVSEHGQRRLQLMRSIADKLLLPIEQLVGTVGGPLRRFVEPAEFRYVRIVRNRRIVPPGHVAVEPAKQGIERTHAAVENPYGHADDRNQQQEVEGNDPPQNRLEQIVLFERRSGYLQFEIVPVPVLKHGRQYPGRLRLVLFGNKHFGVIVNDAGVFRSISLVDRSDRIAVVRTAVQ